MRKRQLSAFCRLINAYDIVVQRARTTLTGIYSGIHDQPQSVTGTQGQQYVTWYRH